MIGDGLLGVAAGACAAAPWEEAPLDVDGAVAVSCQPPSGSLFFFGRRSVDCSAADQAGNEAVSSFSVLVTTPTTPGAVTNPGNLDKPLTGVNGSAQDSDQPTQSPAHLAYVDGAATLEREGQTETAVSGMPFVPGDRLLTTRGRIEVLFSDGTALAIDWL